MSTQSYRIGEVAARAGVSVEALRYYERLGLLAAVGRTERGMRRYAPAAVDRVRFIKQAQALGLSLRDIRQIAAAQNGKRGATCRSVRDLLSRHIDEVEQRLEDLQALRATLKRYRRICDKALGDATDPPCPTLDALDGRRA